MTELRANGVEGDGARRDLQAALVTALRRAVSGPSASEVEDFAQDAMLRILSRLDSFRGDSRFLTWACSIAIRVAMSELRKARWKDLSLERLLEAKGAAVEPRAEALVADSERALARSRILTALERSIGEALTERQRTVVLAELRGVSLDVLASELGTNRNALHKVGHDARKALLAALCDEGIDASTLGWAFDDGKGDEER